MTIHPETMTFRIYEKALVDVEQIEDGYLILSDSGWFSIDQNGQESHFFSLPNHTSTVRTSDILELRNKVCLLSAIYNLFPDSTYSGPIYLGIYSYTKDGNFIKLDTVGISSTFLTKQFTGVEKAEFRIRTPMYAIGQVLANDEMLVVFNRVGDKNGINWKYALLHLNDKMNVVSKREYTHNAFNDWVYDLEQVSQIRFALSRGGEKGYAVDEFDISLNIVSPRLLVDARFNNPILTNILPLNESELILTGHANLGNNPDISIDQNYDFLMMHYDLNNQKAIQILITGKVLQKELCFNSYFTSENQIVMVGGIRGENQPSFDLSAKVKVVEMALVDTASVESQLTNFGGMEGFYIDEDAAGELSIIGRKIGFNRDQHTFMKMIDK